MRLSGDVITQFSVRLHDQRTHGDPDKQGGYDGRGQVRLDDPTFASDTWNALGANACVVEQRVDIEYEISVLVARRPSGELTVYPPSRNHHTSGILTWAVAPAAIDATMTQRAQQLATQIAERIGIIGLLAVEYFVTRDGQLFAGGLVRD